MIRASQTHLGAVLHTDHVFMAVSSEFVVQDLALLDGDGSHVVPYLWLSDSRPDRDEEGPTHHVQDD